MYTYSDLRWLLVAAAVALIGTGAAGQTNSETPGVMNGSSQEITLWTAWQRGDTHYGPNYVQLYEHCQNPEEPHCECTIRFATTSREFADYIASFGKNEVPVVYEVTRGPSGQVQNTRFLRVGTWTRDKFPSPNDGLLGVALKSPTSIGHGHANQQLSIPTACFPPVGSTNSEALSPKGGTSSGEEGGAGSKKANSDKQESPNRPVRISPAVAEGLITNKVQPDYPPKARDKRIQGMVILNVVISEAGTVTDVTV
jgi:hypothetical protein